MTTGLTQSLQTTVPVQASQPTLRRCLVTGEEKPKAVLIRFVLDPEKHVVPDLAGKLPGHGMWVSATRDALNQAVTKNLFTRAAKTKAIVSPDLPDLIVSLLQRRVTELLGLARTSGALVTREPIVLEAMGKGELEAIFLASDSGGDIRKKLSRASHVMTCFTREQLGAALGREHLVTVGLKPHPLTTKICEEMARWQGASAPGDESQPND